MGLITYIVITSQFRQFELIFVFNFLLAIFCYISIRIFFTKKLILFFYTESISLLRRRFRQWIVAILILLILVSINISFKGSVSLRNEDKNASAVIVEKETGKIINYFFQNELEWEYPIKETNWYNPKKEVLKNWLPTKFEWMIEKNLKIILKIKLDISQLEKIYTNFPHTDDLRTNLQRKISKKSKLKKEYFGSLSEAIQFAEEILNDVSQNEKYQGIFLKIEAVKNN